MKWRFWNNRGMESTAELTHLKNQVDVIHNQMVEMDQQLQKLMRLQYKSGKGLEEKLDQLTLIVNDNQEKKPEVHSQAIERLIQQIDDMDMVYSNLTRASEWAELIKKWTSSLIESLSELGVHQCVQPGDLFDPARADAVETIPFEEGIIRSLKPFQIAEIYKRGFIDSSNKQIIRKAQVVTVKENR
jgi:molecular chaperone GrpE (heat shock protein)